MPIWAQEVLSVLLSSDRSGQPEQWDPRAAFFGRKVCWDNWDEGRWPTKAQKHFAKALKETKVTRIKIHDLRHTYAVRFLENGGSIFKATVDWGELARLRLVEKWPIDRLQAHFGLGRTTIKSKLREICGAKGTTGYFRIRNGRVCEVR